MAAAEETHLRHPRLGSLGDISKVFVDFSDPTEVTRYFSFNVSSPLCLTSSLLRSFPGRPERRRLVVNVSSLAALKPFRSWTLYCAGKAARDMMFRVLAQEESDVRVLSYAPGALDSGMQEEVQYRSADSRVRQEFTRLKKRGKLIQCRVSAQKMLQLLLTDAFSSGDHVDYFD